MSPLDALATLLALVALAVWVTVHYTRRWLHR